MTDHSPLPPPVDVVPVDAVPVDAAPVDPSGALPDDAATAAVLAWGRAQLRELPWRATRDPWAILVSEVMAQQTGVDRVVPKWHAFLARWPDPPSLAAARLGDVLELWAGLGYPRRARYLHAAASDITARHDGEVPDRLDALLALPGVGPYTARAVLTFAFEQPVGVVDTNIARVLARWNGRTLTAREAQARADALVPVSDPWSWNQSLMELGASCCRPRPRCAACPLRGACRWHVVGHPEPDPAVGSAGVSRRQAPYAGSDREARGRVLAALISGPLDAGSTAAASGVDDADRSGRILAGLLADGLVVERPDGRLGLP